MIPLLLLQTTVVTAEQSIMQNPAVVLALIACLWGSLVAAVRFILKGHERRLDERFEDTKKRQEETADALSAHVKEEKTETWGRLDAIKDGVVEMRLAQVASMALLSERVTKVETKLPNGALTDVLRALAVTLDRPPVPARAQRRARSPRV